MRVSHRWVPVKTHSTPVLPKREEAVGCSQITNMSPQNQHGSGASVAVPQPATASAASQSVQHGGDLRQGGGVDLRETDQSANGAHVTDTSCHAEQIRMEEDQSVLKALHRRALQPVQGDLQQGDVLKQSLKRPPANPPSRAIQPSRPRQSRGRRR